MNPKFVLCIFFNIICYFNLAAKNENSFSSSDSIDFENKSIQTEDTLINENFGPEYEKLINKADRAYRYGFFRKAKENYKKAALINPKSLFIQYKIKEIENAKNDLGDIISYLNFDKPNVLIKILFFLIIYFTISLFLILIIILVNRSNLEHDTNKKEYLLERYQQLLVDYLFTIEESSFIPNEIRKIAESPFNRKILIDQIIDLSINLSGEVKEKLQHLFLLLNLDRDSIKKAYSQKWDIKVKGFRELAFMNIPDANEEISRSLQSYNDIVRMEAQLAMVRLNHDNPFGFLDKLEKQFTLWEQLTVYETIMFHNLSIPQFDRWLFSKNKSVVMFALRMIEIFKQIETYENLFWMLVNDDEEIRKQTIKVIGNLKIKEALPHLKQLYKGETYDNCLAILHAISRMSDDSMLHFLQLVLDKEDDVQLQIEAAMAIQNTGENGKSTLIKLLDSDFKNYQIIVKHVLDKRIN